MAHDIQYRVVTSLDEVDLDSFYESSLTHLNRNTTWPDANQIPAEVKKHLYLSELRTSVEGKGSYQAKNDTFFMYVIEVDGVDAEFAAGFIQKNKSFRIHWLLTKPVDGSRHWRYTPESREAHRAFLKLNSILTYRVVTFVGAAIYQFMKTRAKTGFYQVTDEKVINTLPDGTQIVILTIDPF